MIIKIAIIILFIALLFGCSDSGRATRFEQSESEKVIISTLPGTEDIYRSKYMSAGMTYEVIYIKAIVGGTGVSMPMQVINLTEDSLKVEQMKQYLEPSIGITYPDDSTFELHSHIPKNK
jgi:hypothetical protein